MKSHDAIFAFTFHIGIGYLSPPPGHSRRPTDLQADCDQQVDCLACFSQDSLVTFRYDMIVTSSSFLNRSLLQQLSLVT